MPGCTANLFLNKLGDAEENLSFGKPVQEDLHVTPPLMPPSVQARHTIAMAIDSLIKGDYIYKDIKVSLDTIRKDTFIPQYLKVEAGYLLVLIERRPRRIGIIKPEDWR